MKVMKTLKVLGREHPDTLMSLADAETMYQRALMGQEMAKGPEHTSMLDPVHNLITADHFRQVMHAMVEQWLATRQRPSRILSRFLDSAQHPCDICLS